MGFRRFVIAVSCSLMMLVASAVMAVEDTNRKDSSITMESFAKPGQARVRLNLDQAVRTTLSRNPRIGEALARIRQRVWQQQEVYSDFFPSATIGYQGTWYRYAIGPGFGWPDHTSRGYIGTRSTADDQNPGISPIYPYRVDPWKRFSGTAAVTQPIYQGGRTVANYDSAKLSVVNSELQLLVDRQDLILAVNQAYYDMMLAEKLLEVNSESMATLRKLKNLNEKFLKAGTVTKTDLLSTENRLILAYVDQRNLTKNLQAARAKLNNLLSNPPETLVEIIQDYKQRANPYKIPGIYATAMANRDEIVQATNEIRKAMEATKVANSDLLPNASLVAQGTRTNDDWNILDPEGNNDWTLTGLLTWSFDFFKKNSTVKEKRDVVNERVLARQRLVQDISQNVKIAFLDMKTSEGNIDDYRRAVAAQTENFRLFQMRYQQGDVSFTDVLIAEDSLVSSKANYYRSLIDYRIYQAVLERAMGVLRQ